LRRSFHARDIAGKRSSAGALQRNVDGGRSVPSGSAAVRNFSLWNGRHG
jgi:hypothetical protein